MEFLSIILLVVLYLIFEINVETDGKKEYR